MFGIKPGKNDLQAKYVHHVTIMQIVKKYRIKPQIYSHEVSFFVLSAFQFVKFILFTFTKCILKMNGPYWRKKRVNDSSTPFEAAMLNILVQSKPEADKQYVIDAR